MNQSQRVNPHHDSQIRHQGHATVLFAFFRIRRHLILSCDGPVLLQEILEQENPPVLHLFERGGFQLLVEFTNRSLKLFWVSQQHEQIAQPSIRHSNQGEEPIQSQVCQSLREEIHRSFYKILMTKCHIQGQYQAI